MDKLVLKLARFDSLASENKFKDKIIINMEERLNNYCTIIEKQNEKIKKMEKTTSLLVSTNGIFLIIVLLFIL